VGRQFFARGVEVARKKETIDPELRMFWAEAAGVLGKPGPPADNFPAKQAQSDRPRILKYCHWCEVRPCCQKRSAVYTHL
jgi:hypothetical protein